MKNSKALAEAFSKRKSKLDWKSYRLGWTAAIKYLHKPHIEKKN